VRVVFFGTPDVAAASLRRLLESGHTVAGVVTQPDKPRGRHGTPQPPPVKEVALAAGVPVLQPANPKQEGFAEELAKLEPEACAVVAYGHLLTPAVLAVPPKGTVNVHFSLLPRYRGAAPVQRAVMAGESETGVSVFVLESTLDTGPVIEQVRVPIEGDDTSGTLLERLGPIGADALVRVLDAIEAGTARPVPQSDAEATPAPKIRPEEEAIDWRSPARDIVNLVRALNPNPGAYTWFRGKRVKVWRAVAAQGTGEPGTVLDPGSSFAIATGDAAVRPLELQPEGKKRTAAADLARGWRLAPGDRFGEAVE
jgi:methionyl-tRNA formyltransferase